MTDFHYVILGPSAASESGKPNPEATKYIREKTSSENKRTYQNAILLLTPSKDGLELLRDRVRDYLGWQRVSGLPDAKTFDDTLKASLKAHIQASQQKIPDAVIYRHMPLSLMYRIKEQLRHLRLRQMKIPFVR